MFVDMSSLVRYKVLKGASGEVASSISNVTGITSSTKKINYPRSEALSHGIFHVEKMPTVKVDKANLMSRSVQ